MLRRALGTVLFCQILVAAIYNIFPGTDDFDYCIPFGNDHFCLMGAYNTAAIVTCTKLVNLLALAFADRQSLFIKLPVALMVRCACQERPSISHRKGHGEYAPWSPGSQKPLERAVARTRARSARGCWPVHDRRSQLTAGHSTCCRSCCQWA